MYRLLEADYVERKEAHDVLLDAARTVLAALNGISPLPLDQSIRILEDAVSKAKIP
jgi:hypothetical protein